MTIGITRVEAGSLTDGPNAVPSKIIETLAINPGNPKGANQSCEALESAEPCTQNLVINDAVSPTTTTRRYCMKATSRASAPNSSAKIIMALAAPGSKPHTAVVPGINLLRLTSHPKKQLMPTVAAVIMMNSVHWLARFAIMDGVIALAIKQPIDA